MVMDVAVSVAPELFVISQWFWCSPKLDLQWPCQELNQVVRYYLPVTRKHIFGHFSVTQKKLLEAVHGTYLIDRISWKTGSHTA